MIVTLDGRRLDQSFDPAVSLQELVKLVRQEAAADRLIVAVSLDGRTLDDGQLGAALPECVQPYAQIDLESADRVQLVRDALRGLGSEFAGLGQRCEAISEGLSGSDLSAAMRDVAGLVELWQVGYRGLTQCSGLLGRDLLQVEVDGQPVSSALGELVTRLTSVREALEAHDMVLLADLVRYELPQLAAQWAGLLNGLADAAD